MKNDIRQLYKELSLELRIPQSLEEITEFCEFIKARIKNQATFVEIGSLHGGSLYLISSILPAGSTVISIDLAGGEWGLTESDKTLKNVCERIAKDFGHKVFRYNADSHSPATLEMLESQVDTIDLLFIDGDHSYEGVKADYEMYGNRFCNDESLIAFHDIHCEEVGVKDFWSVLKKNMNDCHEIGGDYGIGIIKGARTCI